MDLQKLFVGPELDEAWETADLSEKTDLVRSIWTLKNR